MGLGAFLIWVGFLATGFVAGAAIQHWYEWPFRY